MGSESKKPIIYKKYEDGFVVRQMLPEDTEIVQDWFTSLGKVSRADLDVTLSVFPPNSEGFYIGEYEGKPVASVIRIPWDNVFYGSYYYVDEKYRGKGFGTRIKNEVARTYIGNNTCCIDALPGKVADRNLTKFGYIVGPTTCHFQGAAKRKEIHYAGEIKKATEVPFEDLILYDNKNFIRPNIKERQLFLKKWISFPDGAAFVAVNKSGDIVGLACRRKCIQEKSHNIGPIYADNVEVGSCLMQALMNDIEGQHVTMNICGLNKDALELTKRFDLAKTVEFQRMYLNEDPGPPKDTVLALTSIEVCGY